MNIFKQATGNLDVLVYNRPFLKGEMFVQTIDENDRGNKGIPKYKYKDAVTGVAIDSLKSGSVYGGTGYGANNSVGSVKYTGLDENNRIPIYQFSTSGSVLKFGSKLLYYWNDTVKKELESNPGTLYLYVGNPVNTSTDTTLNTLIKDANNVRSGAEEFPVHNIPVSGVSVKDNFIGDAGYYYDNQNLNNTLNSGDLVFYSDAYGEIFYWHLSRSMDALTRITSSRIVSASLYKEIEEINDSKKTGDKEGDLLGAQATLLDYFNEIERYKQTLNDTTGWEPVVFNTGDNNLPSSNLTFVNDGDGYIHYVPFVIDDKNINNSKLYLNFKDIFTYTNPNNASDIVTVRPGDIIISLPDTTKQVVNEKEKLGIKHVVVSLYSDYLNLFDVEDFEFNRVDTYADERNAEGDDTLRTDSKDPTKQITLKDYVKNLYSTKADVDPATGKIVSSQLPETILGATKLLGVIEPSTDEINKTTFADGTVTTTYTPSGETSTELAAKQTTSKATLDLDYVNLYNKEAAKHLIYDVLNADNLTRKIETQEITDYSYNELFSTTNNGTTDTSLSGTKVVDETLKSKLIHSFAERHLVNKTLYKWSNTTGNKYYAWYSGDEDTYIYTTTLDIGSLSKEEILSEDDQTNPVTSSTELVNYSVLKSAAISTEGSSIILDLTDDDDTNHNYIRSPKNDFDETTTTNVWTDVENPTTDNQTCNENVDENNKIVYENNIEAVDTANNTITVNSTVYTKTDETKTVQYNVVESENTDTTNVYSLTVKTTNLKSTAQDLVLYYITSNTNNTEVVDSEGSLLNNTTYYSPDVETPVYTTKVTIEKIENNSTVNPGSGVDTDNNGDFSSWDATLAKGNYLIYSGESIQYTKGDEYYSSFFNTVENSEDEVSSDKSKKLHSINPGDFLIFNGETFDIIDNSDSVIAIQFTSKEGYLDAGKEYLLDGTPKFNSSSRQGDYYTYTDDSSSHIQNATTNEVILGGDVSQGIIIKAPDMIAFRTYDSEGKVIKTLVKNNYLPLVSESGIAYATKFKIQDSNIITETADDQTTTLSSASQINLDTNQGVNVSFTFDKLDNSFTNQETQLILGDETVTDTVNKDYGTTKPTDEHPSFKFPQYSGTLTTEEALHNGINYVLDLLQKSYDTTTQGSVDYLQTIKSFDNGKKELVDSHMYQEYKNSTTAVTGEITESGYYKLTFLTEDAEHYLNNHTTSSKSELVTYTSLKSLLDVDLGDTTAKPSWHADITVNLDGSVTLPDSVLTNTTDTTNILPNHSGILLNSNSIIDCGYWV